MNLKGSKTEQNLKQAFSIEAQANRRYLYFANKADIEGLPDIAALFRSTAEERPATPMATLNSWRRWVIRPAVCRSARPATTCRPRSPARPTSTRTCTRSMAKMARDEGFDEIADWFETLAKAERSHANRYQKALGALAE
jgi:rubrerythrin